jgi:hypothetical protein
MIIVFEDGMDIIVDLAFRRPVVPTKPAAGSGQASAGRQEHRYLWSPSSAYLYKPGPPTVLRYIPEIVGCAWLGPT